VAAFYEQGGTHHLGCLLELEDQYCNWVAGEKSPDRLDAAVCAITELMLGSHGHVAAAISSMPEERQQRRLQEEIAAQRALAERVAAARQALDEQQQVQPEPSTDPQARRALAVLEEALRLAEREAHDEEQRQRSQEQAQRTRNVLSQVRRIRGY
jgi:hypothetical protein